MKVSWDYCSHILWKIKFMFQTTNQMAMFNSYVTNYRPKTRPKSRKNLRLQQVQHRAETEEKPSGEWISNFTNGYKLVEIPPVPVISWFINPIIFFGDICYKYPYPLVNMNKKVWKITMLLIGKSAINGPCSSIFHSKLLVITRGY